MNRQSLRALLKRLLPAPLRAALRGTLNYGERLYIWSMIARHMRGVSGADRAILRRSLLSSPLTSFRQLSEWQDPILLEDATVIVGSVGIFKLRGKTDDLYHVLPTRERAVLEVVEKLLLPGDVFVDAGSNMGFYAIVAARRIGPEGKVVAFEMIPPTAERLNEHVRINDLGNVQVVEKALSATAGQNFSLSIEPGKFGKASIVNPRVREGLPVITVTSTTLDHELRELPRIKLMKMDLEGAEAPAITGGRDALRRIDFIIYERWRDDLDEFREIDNLLIAAGFLLSQIDDCNWLATRPGLSDARSMDPVGLQ